MANRDTMRDVLALLAVTFPGFDRTFGSGDDRTQQLRLDTWCKAFAHRPDELLKLGAARLVVAHQWLDVLPADLHAAIDYIESAAMPDAGKAWGEVWEMRRGVRRRSALSWAEGQIEAIKRCGGDGWLYADSVPHGVRLGQFRDAYDEVCREWLAAKRNTPLVAEARRLRAETSAGLLPNTDHRGNTTTTQTATPNDDTPATDAQAKGFLAKLLARVGRSSPKTTETTRANVDATKRIPGHLKGNLFDPANLPASEVGPNDADRTEDLKRKARASLLADKAPTGNYKGTTP